MFGIMGIRVATWIYLISLNPWLVPAQSVASQAYTPLGNACPDGFSLVRIVSPTEQTLSASEASYVQARQSQVISPAWNAYLANVQTANADLPGYVSDILGGTGLQTPKLGIATSGGGYRSAAFAAGVLNALDGRNSSSNKAGLGGLLQAATYLTGLSGGAWLVTSLAQASFPTMQELVFGDPTPNVANNSWGGWNPEFDLYAPSTNTTIDNQYLTSLFEELEGKAAAGYAVTMADFYGRILARHFINGTSSSNFFDESYLHGAGILWSSVPETDAFASYMIPFPIVTADLSATNQNESNLAPEGFVPISNPIMEFNVFEMGSFDPMLSAFTPTEYLGTRNSSVCITNYDQVSMVTSTSAEVFNEFNATGTLESEFGTVLTYLSAIAKPGIELDAASWPNPFYGVAQDTFIASNQTDLTLVDGGEDAQIIALQPLLVKARGVDVILALDANADINNYADGSSLIVTKNRTNLLASMYSPAPYSFPPIPSSMEEFTAQNLSTRPTFFGCNVTSCADEDVPLIIYLANGGPPRNGEPSLTNSSTFQTVYDPAVVQGILDQSFVVATQGYPVDPNTLSDPEWPACLACAIVDRARERAGEERSGVCESCFARYCWFENVQ